MEGLTARQKGAKKAWITGRLAKAEIEKMDRRQRREFLRMKLMEQN